MHEWHCARGSRCEQAIQHIGTAIVDLDYSYLDGALYQIALTYNPDDFHALLGVLEARYGRPAIQTVEPYQTIGGVKTTNEHVA
jgi:hypothetical protein